MTYTAAIDISTFIWSKDDFDINKKFYYGLLEAIPSIFERVIFLKIPLVIRQELYEQILIEFPYNMAREISYEFEQLTLSFLTNTFSNWILYANSSDNTITSIPILIKQHYSEKIQVETQSQLSHLFNYGKNVEHKFITYRYFFNHNGNLVLHKGKDNLEIETLCFKKENEILDFFDKYKLKFEHNPKHRNVRYYDNVRNEYVSPFSCYFNQGKEKAQKLLEGATFHEGHYYNFDLDNNVFVRFIKTNELVYHAHDIIDEGNNIPNVIKKKFSK